MASGGLIFGFMQGPLDDTGQIKLLGLALQGLIGEHGPDLGMFNK